PEKFDPEDSLWVEVWNNVFIQYNKTADGKYEELEQKSVDTGMGFERIVMVMQGKNNIYETDLFQPIMDSIISVIGDKDITKVRIVADHIKAATFIITDGVEPSNSGRGYILRRLIRRALFNHFMFIGAGLQTDFYKNPLKEIIRIYSDVYPEILNKKKKINEIFKNETERFGKTLEKGLKILNREKPKAQISKRGQLHKYKIDESHEVRLIYNERGKRMWNFVPVDLTGKWLFDFYQTFGFPLELAIEELKKAKNKDVAIKSSRDKLRKEFEKEMQAHQELSRTASAGMFKGGLADSGEETAKLHTATHLLLSALRQVLGNHVSQKGSNITTERLRLDFSHPEKLTDEQKKEVENIVNQKIQENLIVSCKEMSTEQAKEGGALGVFEDKYSKKVKVYSIDDFSREICGGPHVESTNDLGEFKIKKEEASSAGVRRIKAVLK
ncbi:alanine--tRNA ligase-related protein, partial [Patescibacteria group bacterium]